MKHIHPLRVYNQVTLAIKNFVVYWLIPDKWYLFWKFKKVYGRSLNWKNPKSFNEKIQWLKLNDRNPQYHILVDKLRVKPIVAQLIGSEHVIPTYGGGYSRVSDIPRDQLPERFVLKCNHDAASTIVCKDKSTFDWEYADYKMKWCLAHDYYHFENKQWAYKDIDRCIFVEHYMEDEETHELRDYKFFCFNGKVKCFKIDKDRYTNHRANYYDVNCNLLPICEKICPPDEKIEVKIPDNIKEMIALAEKIAKWINNPFVRIDLYNINGQIYFGETTFYPDGGFGILQPEEWDYTLGSWMDLSKLRTK